MTNAPDQIVLLRGIDGPWLMTCWTESEISWPVKLEERADYLRIAALPSLIKPLEFKRVADRHVAQSPFGAYTIKQMENPDFYQVSLYVPEFGTKNITKNNEDLSFIEAEAAANADHRIETMALFDLSGASS